MQSLCTALPKFDDGKSLRKGA
ncbi:MAG: hypothetical protein JWR25_2280, partial [Noviherbaspirillum sp.]|nr:hypothetical protein [Noviherbaspirillum sp.]